MFSQMLGSHIHDEHQQETAKTIRFPSTAIFAVDSGDRFETLAAQRDGFESTPYRFSISRNGNLFNGFVKRLALTEIVFPWYLSNITRYTRYFFYTSSLVGAGVIDLGTTNFRTGSELAANLQTLLRAAGNTGLTCIYVEGQFIIDAQVGNTIAIFPGTNPPDITDVNEYQLFDMMGWDIEAFIPAQIQYSRYTRCRWTEYIDIVCSQLTYNQDLKDNSTARQPKDILARIYLECENDQPLSIRTFNTANTTAENTAPGMYPFTIYRQFSNPKFIQWNDRQPIGNLTFEVYDDQGRILQESNLPNEQAIAPDWRMTLLLSED